MASGMAIQTPALWSLTEEVTAVAKERPAPAKAALTKKEKAASHSLLEEFYIASGFQKIILPPGPVPSTTTMLLSNETPDPFIQEPAKPSEPTKPILNTLEKQPSPPTLDMPAPCTPPSKPSTKKKNV
ncbi:hypothetical protein C0995_012923 [Termitomyces sp. Mi166|nr:hypothetical protein C0995_012923 [Termitomyces sp. Mi166\